MEDFIKVKKRLALEQAKLEVDRALVLEEKKHLKQLQSYQQEELDTCHVKIKDLESKVDCQKKECAAQEAFVRELQETKISQQDEIVRLQQEQRRTEIEWKKEVNDLQAKLETQLNIQIGNLKTRLERCEKSYQDERMQLEAAIELLKRTDGKQGNSDDVANDNDGNSLRKAGEVCDSSTSNEVDAPTDGTSNKEEGKVTETKQSASHDKPSPAPDPTPPHVSVNLVKRREKQMVKDAEVEQSTTSREYSPSPNLMLPESKQKEGSTTVTKILEPVTFISDKFDIRTSEEKGEVLKDAVIDQSRPRPESSPAPTLPPPGSNQVPGPDCRSLHVYLDTERDHASVKGIQELLNNNMSNPPLQQNRDEKLGQMLEEKDDEGRLPIHVACLNKVSAEVIRFLTTKSHASLRAKDSYGWYPIHVAIRYHSDRSVIQCLLDKDPETIGEKDNEGLNCLELAMQCKASEEICKLLKQSCDFLGKPLPHADAIDIWDEVMDEMVKDMPIAELFIDNEQRQAPTMLLDSRFFKLIATKNHRGKTLEAYKALHNRSTMILFSTKSKTPLASLTLNAEDLGCLCMLTARPPPKGATEAYFQGMLNMEDQPFTFTISNLSDEGMINFDVLHSPCNASQVSPGPEYAINATSALCPSQSHVIQEDQRNNCQMILGGMTRKRRFPVLSREKEVSVTVKQAERKSEGLNFYLNVVPESGCTSLVDKFAEGTVWKVVPGFVRRVSITANVEAFGQDEVADAISLLEFTRPKSPAEGALQILEPTVVSKAKSNESIKFPQQSSVAVDVTSTQAAVLKHGTSISDLRNAWMLHDIHRNEQEMEKELKLIKRAVAMDRERRHKIGGDETCTDIRIDNLIVHGISEGTSPREIHDIAAKGVQAKMKQHKKDDGRSDSTSTEDTPHTTNGNSTGVAMAAAETAAAVASSPPPSPKKKEEKESLSPRQPNRYESKGEVPATLPESTEKEEVPMDQETSRVKALAQELNRKESLEFVPPNNRGDPATFKPKNRTVENRAVMDIEYIPDNVGVGIKVPDDEEEVASLETEPEMKLSEAGGVAKIPDELWENDDTDESEEDDAFDLPEDLGHVPGNLPAKKKSSPVSSFKKPGPLTAHLMETKAAAMEHPNARRKDPLEASIGSLKPPGSTFQPASNALPTVSDLPPDGGARGRGPIDEFEIDEAAPPRVPLEEQVTLGSAFVTDRSEPRIAGGPGELEGEDEGTIGQNTVGPTVASSTYGEDRMMVKDQLLLDPHGDKGK
jgi:hypothetical protein